MFEWFIPYWFNSENVYQQTQDLSDNSDVVLY